LPLFSLFLYSSFFAMRKNRYSLKTFKNIALWLAGILTLAVGMFPVFAFAGSSSVVSHQSVSANTNNSSHVIVQNGKTLENTGTTQIDIQTNVDGVKREYHKVINGEAENFSKTFVENGTSSQSKVTVSIQSSGASATTNDTTVQPQKGTKISSSVVSVSLPKSDSTVRAQESKTKLIGLDTQPYKTSISSSTDKNNNFQLAAVRSLLVQLQTSGLPGTSTNATKNESSSNNQSAIISIMNKIFSYVFSFFS
jgi:hypothetical protein